jgi:hypothetical protein
MEKLYIEPNNKNAELIRFIQMQHGSGVLAPDRSYSRYLDREKLSGMSMVSFRFSYGPPENNVLQVAYSLLMYCGPQDGRVFSIRSLLDMAGGLDTESLLEWSSRNGSTHRPCYRSFSLKKGVCRAITSVLFVLRRKIRVRARFSSISKSRIFLT